MESNNNAVKLQGLGEGINAMAGVPNSFLSQEMPLKETKPETLVYAREFDMKYIPGESSLSRKQFPKGTGSAINSLTDVLTWEILNRSDTIDGSKSFIVLTLKAAYADGTDVVDETVELAPEACNIAFERIDLTVNNEVGTKNPRQDVIRHVMRRLTTNCGDRSSGAYLNEMMNDDHRIGDNLKSDIGKASVFNGPIQNGKTFQLVRYLDDLPFFGQLEADIPGGTSLRFDIKYCSDSSRMFRGADADGKCPIAYILMSELYIHQNKLTQEAALEIDRAITNPSIPFYYTTDKWEASALPEGNIPAAAGRFTANISRILLSTPDVAFICLFPSSSFNAVGNSNTLPSIYNKSWGNVRSFYLRMNGRVMRNYFNLDNTGNLGVLYKGIVNCLSGPQDAMPVRGFSPLDYDSFINGPMAIFPLDLRYISSKSVQNPQIGGIDVEFEFGSGGASTQLVPYLITKSKALYEYTPDGQIKMYR